MCMQTHKHTTQTDSSSLSLSLSLTYSQFCRVGGHVRRYNFIRHVPQDPHGHRQNPSKVSVDFMYIHTYTHTYVHIHTCAFVYASQRPLESK